MLNPRHLAMAVLISAMFTPTARAWHDEGHLYTALAAVRCLPDDLPAFFIQGAPTIAHCSIDPDVFRNDAAASLIDATAPDHFFDLELWPGGELPRTRYAFLRACYEKDLDPARLGTLPYAIVERAQRLTIAFAEHRAEPDNPHIRSKCLVYAGLLAHMTADLEMPLHTTVHYDGRATRRADGSWSGSPRTGIHARIDALPTKLPYNRLFAEPLPAPMPIEGDLLDAVMDELIASHGHVGRAYELADRIPALHDLNLDDPDVIDFTTERTRAAASFTARVIADAWRRSADVKLENWLDRRTLDEHLDPDRVPPQPQR